MPDFQKRDTASGRFIIPRESTARPVRMRSTSAGYRYRVVAFQGQVPDQVAGLVGKEGGYLVYDQYLGRSYTQHFVDSDEIVGAWDMVYAGRRPGA